MAQPAIDPYYYQSRMRELSGQKELTTGRGLTQGELESILNAELSQRYTAEQNRRSQRIQEKALDAQTKAQEDAAEAAKLGGYAQLGVAGAYVGSKVPAIAEAGKSAYNWVTGAAPAVTSMGAADTAALASTAAIDPATGLMTTGYGGMAGGPASIGTTALGYTGVGAAGYAGGKAGEYIVKQTPIEEITPWGGEKTETVMGGIAGGAAAGAAVGSVVPVVGTAVGAVVGGIIGGLSAATEETVICTELSRQGYIPKEILDYEHIYRLKHIDYAAYTGYRKLADPIIPLMQKSKIVTWLILPFGKGVAYEMAHRANPEIKGSRIGCFILKHGLPICRWIVRRGYKWQTS